MKSTKILSNIRVTIAHHTDNIIFVAATIALSATGLIGNLVAARYVTPGEMGVLQAPLVIAGYLGFLHFGIFSGIQRNIPISHGRNDITATEERIAESWLTAKVNAGLCALFTIVTALWLSRDGLIRTEVLGIVVLAATAITTPLILHCDIMFRCSRSLRSGGVAAALASIGSAAAGLLPVWFGQNGLLLRLVITPLWIFASKWCILPIRSTRSATFSGLLRQAKDGLPELLVGQLYIFFTLADRSIIGLYLSDEALGAFTLASMVTTGLQLLPTVVASLVYPRIAFEYGRTGEPSALRRLMWRGLLLSICLCLPIGLVTYFSIGPLIERFAPKYQSGIRAAQIATLGSIMLFYVAAGPIISTLRKNIGLGIASFAALGVVWLVGWFAVHNNYGIEGVAVARLLATAVLAIFTIGYAMWLTRANDTL